MSDKTYIVVLDLAGYTGQDGNAHYAPRGSEIPSDEFPAFADGEVERLTASDPDTGVWPAIALKGSKAAAMLAKPIPSDLDPEKARQILREAHDEPLLGLETPAGEPAEDTHAPSGSESGAGSEGADYDGMTKKELNAELDKRGIEHDAKAKNDGLVKLLQDSDAASGSEVTPRVGSSS
jgi:hypothetical protein